MSQPETAFLEAAGDSVFTLLPEKNTLGRAGGGATIEIADKSLSRHHAEIEWDGSQWLVRDLKSTNKTFLNNRPLEPDTAMPLNNGDQIHLGKYALSFRIGTPGDVKDMDATMPLDPGSLPMGDMFIKAGMKSLAPTSDESGISKAIVADVAKGDPLLNPNAFAFLELRSVTSPTKYFLTKTSVRVGSDATAGCDIVIPEKGIESLHIEIRFMGGKKVRLRNLSQSGTLVNGKRAGSIPIIDGDLIDIGDSSFTFRVLKLPEIEKKGSGVGAFLAIAGVLFVLLLAGGGYWYKVNVMDKQVEAAPTVAVSTPAPPTSTVPIARAVEQIRRLEFANAAQTAALVAAESKDPDLTRRAQSMKEHLDMLLNAQTMANNRMFLEARTTVLRIPEGEVRDLAGDEIRRLDMLSTQFINNTISQIRDAENREQWAQALTALDTLRGTTDQMPIDPAQVRERIELKRRASEEVELANKTPLLDHYELTLQRVQNLQNDIKRRAEQDPTLTQELEQYSRSLQNVAAHSELIGEYLRYRGGPMDKIREMDAAIHPGYSAIRDVRRIVSNAERIQRLQASYETMLKDLQATSDITNLTRQQEQLIANRQEIIAMETSAKFELAQEARKDLVYIQDLRSGMIVAKWREAPVQTNTTDKEMLLMFHVDTRRHAFEVLSLFDPEIRRRIQSVTDIPLHVPEPQLQSVYASALEAYGTGFSRASAVIYEAIVDPNPTFRRIRDDAPKLVNMLRDTTLPEDDNSRRQLDRLLEEQLKGRSR